MSLFVPYVIESHGRGKESYDLFTRLLKDRIVFINTEITDASASVVIAQLLFLASDSPGQDIKIYINSPGGSVTAGLAIYDTMQYVGCEISTYCLGQASSMGAFLLAAGTKGKRYALPHSRIMIHQPWGGVQGTAQDITIHAEEILELKKELNRLLAQHTGQEISQLEEDSDRDNFMSPIQAKEYGLIDEVLEPRPPQDDDE
jgi:ATP-dependent Clp protease protease subunit